MGVGPGDPAMAEEERESGPIGPSEVAHRLAGFPERAMREAVLGDLLEPMEASEAVWLLDGLATAGRAGGPPFDVALVAAVDLASGNRLSYDRRRELFETAGEHGLEACQELLFSDELGSEEDAAAPRSLRPGTRPLTLGERKSLARSWKRDILEKLLVDPHADVVALLLQNSRLTEDDVLRIATARRSSSAVLSLVLSSRRWGCRARIRRALVRNPRLPEASALRLIGLLNRAELRELASDPRLPGRVRAAVQRRLRSPV
jgi:hypothetical protein